MVRNVHERVIAAPPAAVGALLDSLGSADDRLWPTPPHAPMVLRHSGGQGLAVGARGGHDDVRYSVEAYEPGRRVTFRFAPDFPISGTHSFVLEPAGSGTRVRHESDGVLRGSMRLLWPLAVRAMHNCYIEDAFDRAERELGVGPARNHRHPLWVRLFERRVRRRVTETAPLLAGLGAGAVARVDAADAYRTDVLPGDGTDPVEWTEAIFAAVPWWIRTLLGLRHLLVRPFGLKTGGRATPFPLIARTESEALAGLDDRHLDFRVVTTVDESNRSVSLTTIVHVHSRLGRVYWAVVRHIHPVVLRSLIRRTAHPVGAPTLRAVPAARSTREELSEQA